MLKFALRNMAVKKIQIILIIFSVVISAGTGVLAYNTSSQVSDGITGNAAYYSCIIGPSGSKTQLAMNTMYFTDEPLGVIPYSLVSQLSGDTRVRSVVPFAMADNFNGYSVIGTTSAFLSGRELGSGEMFDDSGTMQAVLGYTVAKTCGISVGDTIYTGHAVGQTHAQGLTVTGILEQSHTVYDNQVFTQLKTIWDLHESEEDEEAEDEDHLELNGMVCAILVKTMNPSYGAAIVNEYDTHVYTAPDGESYAITAIEPMATVRGVLEDTDNTKYIVFVLCAVILIMNIIIISIITLLNMYHSAAEISLMRLIGISMKKINGVYLIQNGIIGLVSCVLAFVLSKVCLLFMGSYVASMGVVLNQWKVYPAEFAILAAVFAISIIPTVLCTRSLSRRDSLS